METVIESYLAKFGVDKATSLEYEEANALANTHVISFYRNRITLREVRAYTAGEIAEKLAYIADKFGKAFDDAWTKHIEN